MKPMGSVSPEADDNTEQAAFRRVIQPAVGP